MAEPLRAAIYRRISQDRQHKRRGVDRQLEDCLWDCEQRGYIFDEKHDYCDNDTSAFTGEKRSRYEDMLRDFRNGEFDIIVAWKMDRLTRSTYGTVDMIRELGDYGLRIYTEDLGEQDLSTTEGRNRAISAAMRAEEESERKSQREKSANLQRAKEGEIKRGTRCFGYDGDFNIIEDEATIVKAIYEAYYAGVNMSAISRAIAGNNPDLPDFPKSDAPAYKFAVEKNQRRIAAGKEPVEITKKREWALHTTQQILRNPRYCGYVAYVPTIGRKCQSPKSHWVDFIMRGPDGTPVKAVWEPIVNPDLWWQVQAKLDNNKKRSDGSPINRSGFPKKYFGSGVYRCGVCGGPMKSGDQSYRCDGHVTRMRKKVDLYVLEAIRERLARDDLKDALAKIDNSEIKRIDKELAEVRGDLQAIQADYKRHPRNASFLLDCMTEKKDQIDRLEAERRQALPNNAGINVISAADPVAAFDNLTDPGQVAEVINFLATITLKPSKRGYRQTRETLEDNVVIEWK